MTSDGGPRTLAGRYRLDEVIGRGGMSTVYRGTDLALDRVVAVKVALDPLVEQSAIYVARFTREAQAAAAIGHPNVVTVYDAGADGPTRFIVMELVHGRSLADILRDHERKPLDLDRAADIARQVAGALSAAHAAGIIHRDVKPGNIMVAPDGSVKVFDFGIARALDGRTLTQTATVLGTSAYMSPEQALGQPVDARSDIYSLGCVLYEMLTGEPPFVADLPAAVLHQHVRVEPKPARERNPAIPPALNDLVMQMLAKSPNDRPQTAAEVRDRLGPAEANLEDGGDALTTIALAATPATLPVEAAEPPHQAEPLHEAEPLHQAEPPTAPAPLAPRPSTQRPTRPPTPEPTNRQRTSAPAPPPPSPRKSTTAFWITVLVLAALLLGGAAAVALNAGGAGTSATTGHSSAPDTGSHTTAQTAGSHTSAQTTTSQPPATQHSTSSATAPALSSPNSTRTSTTSTVGTTPRTATSGATTSPNAQTTGTSARTTGTSAATTTGTTTTP